MTDGDPWQQEREAAEWFDAADIAHELAISRGECPVCEEPIEVDDNKLRCTFCDWEKK